MTGNRSQSRMVAAHVLLRRLAVLASARELLAGSAVPCAHLMQLAVQELKPQLVRIKAAADKGLKSLLVYLYAKHPPRKQTYSAPDFQAGWSAKIGLQVQLPACIGKPSCLLMPQCAPAQPV